MEGLTIDGVTLDKSQARVTLLKVKNMPGVAATVFDRVAEANIFVDMIVQSYGENEQADLTITVPRESLENAISVLQSLSKELGCGGVTSSPSIAKLSVSGIGLRSHTDVAIRMFRGLAEAGINVQMINTSEVRVNVVVDGASGDKALTVLQEAFADALH